MATEVRVSTSTFLNLPREIRDKIYVELLTATSGSVKTPIGGESHRTYAKLVRNVQVQILRVNKQLCTEGQPVLERSNGLIGLYTDHERVVNLLVHLDMPFVFATEFEEFDRGRKHEVLRINFLKSQHDPKYRCLFYFIPEDHAAVVRVLGDVYILEPRQGMPKNIDLDDPEAWKSRKFCFWLEVADWSTSPCRNVTLEELLAPYRQHLRSMCLDEIRLWNPSKADTELVDGTILEVSRKTSGAGAKLLSHRGYRNAYLDEENPRYRGGGLQRLSTDILDIAKTIRLDPHDLSKPEDHSSYMTQEADDDFVIDPVTETTKETFFQELADLLLDVQVRRVQAFAEYITDDASTWERKGRCTKPISCGMIEFAKALKYDVYDGQYLFDEDLPWTPDHTQMERLCQNVITAAAATKDIREIRRAIGSTLDMLTILKVKNMGRISLQMKKRFEELS